MSQTSVTSSCPFGDWSSKFAHWPENVRSTNSCQIQTLHDNLRAYFWQFSNRFPILPSWNDDHPCKDLRRCTIALSCCSPIRNISRRISRMSFHVVRPCNRRCVRFSPTLEINCSVAPAVIRDSNISLYWLIIISFVLHSCWVHPKYTWSRNEVGSSRSTFFINFFHMGAICCFFPVSHFNIIHVYW